jgi:sugar/nucleoside kinase (ribokinase family)
MGSIGNDRFGKHLTQGLSQNGINECFHVHENLRTGVCAVLLNGVNNRCLIPNLGAAGAYPESHTTGKWVDIE